MKRKIVYLLLLIVAFATFILNLVLTTNSFKVIEEKNQQNQASIISGKLTNELKEIVDEAIAVSEVMAHDSSFVELIENNREEDISKYLQGIHNYFSYNSVFFADYRTNYYYSFSAQKKLMREDSDDSRWFFDFVENGLDKEVNINVNNEDVNEKKVLTAFVNVRVEDEDENLIGVCGLGVTMFEIEDKLREYSDKYDIKICVENQDKVVDIAQDILPPQRVVHIANGKKNQGDYVYTSLERDGYVVSNSIQKGKWDLIIYGERKIEKTYRTLLFANLAAFIFFIVMLFIGFLIIFLWEKRVFKKRAEIDKMTGLFNKEEFFEEVNKILSERYSTLAFLFIDLDNFKRVNDELGHRIGDEAIRESALVIKDCFRESDLKARFGGDEFLVCMRDIPRNVLDEKLNELLKGLQKTYSSGNKKVHVTPSIGVTYVTENKALRPEELLEASDKACYKAKNTGKNKYIIENY